MNMEDQNTPESSTQSDPEAQPTVDTNRRTLARYQLPIIPFHNDALTCTATSTAWAFATGGICLFTALLTDLDDKSKAALLTSSAGFCLLGVVLGSCFANMRRENISAIRAQNNRVVMPLGETSAALPRAADTTGHTP